MAFDLISVAAFRDLFLSSCERAVGCAVARYGKGCEPTINIQIDAQKQFLMIENRMSELNSRLGWSASEQ